LLATGFEPSFALNYLTIYKSGANTTTGPLNNFK
jgi:hypothetical protein